PLCCTNYRCAGEPTGSAPPIDGHARWSCSMITMSVAVEANRTAVPSCHPSAEASFLRRCPLRLSRLRASPQLGRSSPARRPFLLSTSHEPFRAHAPQGPERLSSARRGFVTLPCREREVSVPQELSGRRDSRPPRGHRSSAKRAVRLG